MTPEEKKKYLEAVEEAKRLYKTANSDQRYVLETLFPEIRESEDEKIRKAAIAFVEASDHFLYHLGISKEDVLAWLENLKEFVSADFDDVWETAECDELTAPLEKYSKDTIKEMCHAWYDKGIELERKSWIEKQGGQKQEWSEDDEKQARQIERIVHDDGCTQKLQKQIADWLKSIKDKIQKI